ncbi:MAG: DUF177 domain-containing protein [Bacteroidota bacterium]
MQINIARIAEGAHHHTFEALPSDLELDEPFVGPIRVGAEFNRTGRQYLLHASFESKGVFTCDRCLDRFDLPLTGSYRILYVPESSSAPATGKSGEVQTVPSDAQVITLDEDLRQFLELAIPKKLLCREECQGLCPTCGTNLNTGSCSCEKSATDPRWDALKKLSKS